VDGLVVLAMGLGELGSAGGEGGDGVAVVLAFC
jgi:hypothetical protein